jgi:hypothetical protein
VGGIEKLDKKDKSQFARFNSFITNWLPTIVGAVIVIQILINSFKKYGTEAG